MSVSGLSPRHVRQAVDGTLQAAIVALHHASRQRYTQDGSRWSGIDRHRVASKGEFPPFSDCSAFVTWCFWNGLFLRGRHSDIINGQDWHAGYTGTMLGHGRRVGSPIPGDAIIYGTRFPGEHTALYTGGGLVVSHGGDPGPLLLPWRYREDILAIHRYI